MTNRNQFEEVDEDDGASLVSLSAIAVTTKAELDQAIATAKAFPRSLKASLNEAKTLVTLSEEMAEACIYALPRRDENGKPINITGPSARFAEILQYSYGNNRGGGRVIAEEDGFIVAEGVYHDLEKNTHVSKQVRRRITDKKGRKFKADMIMVTGNAAVSIAHRNAVLAGIPKAIWLPIYEAARQVAFGDGKTIAERRQRAFEVYHKRGVTKEQLFEKLGVKGEEDIGLDELELLIGLNTAIREGTTTVDREFSKEREPAPGGTTGGLGDVAATIAAKRNGTAATAEAAPSATPAAVEPSEARQGEAAKPEPDSEGQAEAAIEITLDSVSTAMRKATNRDELDDAYSLVGSLTKAERQLATDLYHDLAPKLED